MSKGPGSTRTVATTTDDLREHAAEMLRWALDFEQTERDDPGTGAGSLVARGILDRPYGASYDDEPDPGNILARAFLAEAYDMCASDALYEEIDRVGEDESVHPVMDVWALAYDVAIGNLYGFRGPVAPSARDCLVIALESIERDIEHNARRAKTCGGQR